VKSKLLTLASAATAGAVVAHTAVGADWPSAGADLNNSRYQSNETRISADTVGSLQLKWTLDTNGDVTAHPTVDGNNLYFPDSAGFLYKVEKKHR
jgi:polyvinyl alcohol dehydrogenase (cytochrome)